MGTLLQPSMVSPITTHILDTAKGCPAPGVPITFHLLNPSSKSFEQVGAGETNEDGRCPGLLEPGQLQIGTYKIVFNTETYFNATNTEGFYPYAEVVFIIRETE